MGCPGRMNSPPGSHSYSGEKCLNCPSGVPTVLVPPRLVSAVKARLWGSLPSVLWPWLWAYLGLLISFSGLRGASVQPLSITMSSLRDIRDRA